MSILLLYGAGFVAGSMYLSKLDDVKYQFFRKCFYEPHKNYSDLKKYKNQNRIDQTYEDMEYYVKSVFLNGANFFYYYLYGKKREFIFYKQQNNFELIRNFEFMNETINDYDNIIKKIKERIERENKDIDDKMIEKENLEEDLKKDFDDKNLENLILLQENTKDQFTKFVIQNNIQSKSDYDKTTLPQIKLQKESNKIAFAQAIENSRKLWEDRRKENLYDISNYKTETKRISIADVKEKEYIEGVRKQNSQEIEKIRNEKKQNEMPKKNGDYSDFEDLFNMKK